MDVRRIWECPACSRRVKRHGDISSYQCHCQEPAVWMRLVEIQRGRRDYLPYLVPEIEADELLGDEEPSAPEVPLPEQPAAVVEVIIPPETEPPPSEEVVSVDAVVSPAPSPSEKTAAQPPESPTTETPTDPDPNAKPSPEGTVEKKSRKGRSRRRRSSQKRSRRPGSQGGGGGGS